MSTQNDPDLVVVGADGSWQSQKAVRAAAREAATSGSPLLLLTVAAGELAAGGLAQLRRMEEDAMVLAHATSQRAVQLVGAHPDLRVDSAVVGATDAPELDAVVDRTRLLVLGDHGRRGEAAFATGSTSAALARRFRSPVLLPRLYGGMTDPGPDRSATVHVGLGARRDESDLLRLAARQAANRGSDLVVLHAVPVTHDAAREREALEAAWRAVRLVPECEEVTCRLEVVRGDPVGALLDRCGPDDVLVVGTRGGGTLAGLVRGSVARGVLDGLPCDVIVVPPWARVT
ncbi:universal stress protein [Oryzobacter terrae]|uniref:universal stress protein n=1 Tax=Oryzobacter terrae TaxID=1620385 RepID=UPI00366FD8B6